MADRWSAGVIPYAEMGYWEPDYVPKDTDVLCAFRITPQDGQLHLLAGGEVAGAVPRAQAEARIAAVLEDGARRARWLRWAA